MKISMYRLDPACVITLEPHIIIGIFSVIFLCLRNPLLNFVKDFCNIFQFLLQSFTSS